MDLIAIENSRSNANRIEFSIQLLVEIALRALSPGVNDTYTAIAVVDSLSKAILVVSDKQEEYSIQYDEDEVARLYSFHRSAKQIVGISFHPLRRASTDNILMAQAIAKVYSRLYESGTEKLQEIVFVCSEYRGISKAGGISVMVADLSEKLALLGSRVIIITPWYDNLQVEKSDFLKNAKRLDDISIETDKSINFEIYRARKFLLKNSSSYSDVDSGYIRAMDDSLNRSILNTSYSRQFVPFVEVYMFKNKEIYPSLYPQ
jgi:hypothetical protein